jgi:hypothetical protein
MNTKLSTEQKIKAIESARKISDFIETLGAIQSKAENQSIGNMEKVMKKKRTRESIQGCAVIFFNDEGDISPSYFGWISFGKLLDLAIFENRRLKHEF